MVVIGFVQFGLVWPKNFGAIEKEKGKVDFINVELWKLIHISYIAGHVN